MIDVKGMATDTAKLKAKLFRYKYPDVMLTWICKAPKYTGLEWIEYDELIKSDVRERGRTMEPREEQVMLKFNITGHINTFVPVEKVKNWKKQ